MNKKNIAWICIVPLLVVSFLDLNNRLPLGPKDEYGFTPFDHGIFGTFIKVLLGITTLYCLYVLISSQIQAKPLALALAIIAGAVLVVAGSFLAFSLYFTF